LSFISHRSHEPWQQIQKKKADERIDEIRLTAKKQ
jgi:hypothetical protein